MFWKHDVNMTRIESKPKVFEYVVYLPCGCGGHACLYNANARTVSPSSLPTSATTCDFLVDFDGSLSAENVRFYLSTAPAL